MTADQCRAFLLERPRTATLATVRADGRPHSAPIWIAPDGEAIVFTTWHAAVKARNLRRDGRRARCVDDDTPPFSYVIIEGPVAIGDTRLPRRSGRGPHRCAAGRAPQGAIVRAALSAS